MAREIERIWRSSQAGIDIPRADRWEGRIDCYVPDRLLTAEIVLNGKTAADVADAEHAIVALDAKALALTNTEALARLLLRAEAVASSNIEGLVVSPQRILRSDARFEQGEPITDLTVREVLGNIDAIKHALDDPDAPITIERLNAVHKKLLEGTRAERLGGAVRTEQNWIGGPSRYTPYRAAFVPPPPELVEGLLIDLCEFANDDMLPPVAQAAIAHAQFETIHPYADGNGRTGRALIYMILRRRRLARRCIPPISLVLATHGENYVSALQATRQTNDDLRSEALARWIALFALACRTAVRNAEAFEAKVEAIVADWNSRVSDLRADAAARRIVSQLPTMPIITARSAEKFLGKTFATANNAIDDLVSRGILASRGGARNRTFEATELIDAFADLERALGSPDSDTRSSLPTRPVPARRRKGSASRISHGADDLA